MNCRRLESVYCKWRNSEPKKLSFDPILMDLKVFVHPSELLHWLCVTTERDLVTFTPMQP